ncbi:hypothetical protein DQF64_11900 [Moraxella bovis]|nr:hypothetical protein DQF64_11900 [Moraxella bovis]
MDEFFVNLWGVGGFIKSKLEFFKLKIIKTVNDFLKNFRDLFYDCKVRNTHRFIDIKNDFNQFYF